MEEGKANIPWRSAFYGAALCALLGLGLDYFNRLGGWLGNLSYDFAVMFRSRAVPPDLIIIYMDEKSFDELKQNPRTWDRGLHADLINWLTREHVKLVVLDVVLTDTGSPDKNKLLAQAIQANGNVVLAGGMAQQENAQLVVQTSMHPSPEFETVAAGWGPSEVERDSIVRQFHPGDAQTPSLAWVAAERVGASVSRNGQEPDAVRWLNYYGPPGMLPSVSYCEVTNQPAGYFRDKVVFVGSKLAARYARDQADDFRTPHTRAFHGRMPGVEIAATAFLNLVHDDWLTRLPFQKEWRLIVAAGLLFGFGLCCVRPGVAWVAAAISIIALAVISNSLAWQARLWAAWTIPAGAQIPFALLWSWLAYTRRLRHENQSLEEALTKTRLSGASSETTPMPLPGVPAIPDHTLLKCVGQGGYGEVWLARNAIGSFHAVKIVYRRAFASDDPYEREFKGIQHFMPISRSHPGLVHILHVGRNDHAGFFFCIMEVGDDEQSGQEIQPESYSPKTLANLLERHGPLSVSQCIGLGADLAAALEHMHQKHLIHRDIKPANIIYVGGAPKFADIGLVTSMAASRNESVSCVGTEGFIAPEGPGTASADVYSLGKVLYEACMGEDRRRFPELPTAIYEAADYKHRAQLNEIIVKACATTPQKRYQSAAQLRADLLKL